MNLKRIKITLYSCKHIDLSSRKDRLFLAALTLLLTVLPLSSCTSNQNVEAIITPISSLDSIKGAGFYVYTLPQTIVTENEWQAEVYMYSFDAHCNPANDTLFNPVSIAYRDKSGEPILNIRVSPSDGILGGSASAGDIQLDSKWVSEGKGHYYVRENGEVIIRFVDTWGMDVVISSTHLSLDELVSIIEQLEYSGPNLDTVQNPWSKACEQ